MEEEKDKQEQQFCILCGKYVDHELKPATVGVINYIQPPNRIMRIPVIANGCQKCEVVMNNANRIYQEAKANFQKEIMAKQEESKIIHPEMGLPEDFFKKIKS